MSHIYIYVCVCLVKKQVPLRFSRSGCAGGVFLERERDTHTRIYLYRSLCHLLQQFATVFVFSPVDDDPVVIALYTINICLQQYNVTKDLIYI